MKRLILFLSMVLVIVISANADVIEVDGLYFNRGESDVVTLTTPPTGVYAGKIHIPHKVSYGGQTYEVNYNLDSALSNSDITELSFGEGFTKIGGLTTNCPKLKRIQLPSTLEDGEIMNSFRFCDNAICAVVMNDGENLRIKAEVFNIYDTSGKKLEPYLVNKQDRSRVYLDKDGCIIVPTRNAEATLMGIVKAGMFFAVEFYVDINGKDVYVQTIASYWKSGDKVIVDGIRYDILGDGTGACVSRDIVDCDYTGDIMIASSVNYNGRDYPVTVIDQYAFMNTDIRSVTMPSTLKYIGYYKSEELDYSYSEAFSGCVNLTTVNLNEGLERIAQYSFADCKNLKTVKLPNSLKKIGRGAFSGCVSLSSINIPENVEDDGNNWSTSYWFKNCTSLEHIEIPDNIWNLGSNMFAGCTNLKTVKLGKGIKSIGDRCFAGCEALEDFVIPNNVVCDNPFTDNTRYCSLEVLENENDRLYIHLISKINYVDNNRFTQLAGCNASVYSYQYQPHGQYTIVKTREFAPDPVHLHDHADFSGYIMPEDYVSIDNRGITRYGYITLDVFGSADISGSLATFYLTPDKTSGIEDVIVDDDDSAIECKGPVSVYDLQGIERYHGERDAMPKLPRGVYIIRTANGKAEKVKF